MIAISEEYEMTSFEPIKVATNVYWVGTNDSETKLFEGLWEIPEGVSYNSYLIQGSEKIALIDSVHKGCAQEHIERIAQIIDISKINYIIVNHMEPDHTGAIPYLLEKASVAQLVLTPIALNIYKKYYEPEPKNSFVVKGDDTQISLGDKTLKFFQTPWLHWPETMSTYLQEEKILFSGDAFGAFTKLPINIVLEENIPQIDQYVNESSMKYFASVFNGQKEWILRAKEKFQQNNIDIQMLAPTHGPVYSVNSKRVVDKWESWSKSLYSKKVVVAYCSMYGMTAKCIEPIMDAVREAGGQAIAFCLSEKTAAEVITQLVDSPALIIGCPTYEHEIFPKIRQFLDILQVKKFSSRYAAVFGSFSWSGEAAGKTAEQLTTLGFKMVDKPVSFFGNPTEQDIEKVKALAKNLAETAFNQNKL